jgi:hypothetical protein
MLLHETGKTVSIFQSIKRGKRRKNGKALLSSSLTNSFSVVAILTQEENCIFFYQRKIQQMPCTIMEREDIISSRKENADLQESPLSPFCGYMTIL